MNLVVVLKDYRKKDTPQCRREVDKRQKNRLYYQRNRDRILAQREEYRQKDPEHFRVKETKRKREYRPRNRDRVRAAQNEYRQRNLEKIRERERRLYANNRSRRNQRSREYYQQNRDCILTREKARRQRKRDVQRGEIREKERVLEKKRNCDCGLCLVCGGFTAASWSSKFDYLLERSEVNLEDLDRRCRSESDTSSLVDPQLVEELERMLNEPSECWDLSDEEDELEERLIALRTHREQGIQRRLEQWEKERELEESIQYLAGDLGAVNQQLIDMERAFAQYHREDTVTQVPEFEYLHTVTITSDLMSQLEQNLLY